MRKIAITTGDPAGIGPEITASALRFFDFQDDFIYVVYGSLNEIESGNIPTKIKSIDEATQSGILYHLPFACDCKIGEISKDAGKTSLDILNKVSEDLNNKKLDAVVTAPISKSAIHKTELSFIGHTEFFAEKSQSENVVMSFWGPHYNLALLTTHTPISQLSEVLTEEYMEKKLKLIIETFRKYDSDCTFAMLGINPHAGENGAFGDEDIRLEKVLDKFKDKGISIEGPIPADTFFTKEVKHDVVISAYHDQGLIPFKMVSMEQGVNVTLGLPYIRTSVDHGTAFNIAGQGIASDKSLIAAIHQAEQMLMPEHVIEHLPYSGFAQFYDQYMEHVEYEEWVQFILGKFNKLRKRSPKKILELACGTANVAEKLVKRGLNVDASDLIPEMVKIAAQKANAPNLSQADMMDKISDVYDLILVLFDSMNYLTSSDEIDTVLENTYEALEDDGLLIFDISTEKNCMDYFDGFVNIDESNGTYFVHTAEYVPDAKVQQNKFEFFKKMGNLYKRISEVHHQAIFPTEIVLEIVKASSFKLKGIYSLDSDQNLKLKDGEFLDENFTRLFFVLQK